MKILHTSDWHLGRQFHGVALDDDHDFILGQILDAIKIHKPSVLIIAGDIFDRTNPPQTSLKRFSDFLSAVRKISTAAIILIAGNHDSAAQIGMLGVLTSEGEVLVRGPLDRDEKPLIVFDEHGPVAISALPFSFEYAARLCFEDDSISCPADVIRAQIASAAHHINCGMRWIVVAHAFVDGAATSENERPLARTVGGIETVSASVFAGANYVALGHLHRPQSVGQDYIRYSGSPLAFGFDEEGQEKSLSIVNLNADGSVGVVLLPIKPLRAIRTVSGKLQELLATSEASNDFMRVVLMDETPQIDPMKRIRQFYPNAVQLTYQRNEKPREMRKANQQMIKDDPAKLTASFIDYVRNDPLSELETTIVEKALVELQVGEDGE
jgi:DNA repair protein SbcD/Mre11